MPASRFPPQSPTPQPVMGKTVRCRECGKVYRELDELEDLRDNDSVCLVCNSTIEVADWDRILASYEDDENDLDDVEDDDDWDDDAEEGADEDEEWDEEEPVDPDLDEDEDDEEDDADEDGDKDGEEEDEDDDEDEGDEE